LKKFDITDYIVRLLCPVCPSGAAAFRGIQGVWARYLYRYIAPTGARMVLIGVPEKNRIGAFGFSPFAQFVMEHARGGAPAHPEPNGAGT
jgi:hypothetical protein